MKIGIVSPEFPPEKGGIQTYAHELACRFAARGVELTVVTPRSEGSALFDAHSRLRLQRLAAIGDDLALSGIAPLALLLRKQRFDVAFTTHWAPGFAVQQAARLTRQKLPVFVAAHGKELIHHPLAKLPIAQAVYDRVRAQILGSADGFFPVSNRTAELLRERGVSAQNIHVVHNGVDARLYQPRAASALRAKLSPNGPMLLSVARLVSRKGIDTVLRALPALLARVPSATYVVVGDGPDRERLHALAREQGVLPSVRFVPSVSHDLGDYYNACDLFVMPAREEAGDIEGFGLVFLEAGACGKPVIGARAGGVVDAIVQDVTGLLVPPDDASALAQAMIALVTDPQRAAAMGSAARERVLREGTWDHSADKILAVLGSARR